MSFTNLGLKPELSRAVAEKGYVTPTPIQREAIPAVLARRDVLAGAQTGTGKTAAFVLPILQNLASRQARAPRPLELLPRERQNLMFSATCSEDIRELAGRFLRNPVAIEVAARNATAERIEQHVYRVPKEHKRYLLAHLIDSGNWHQVLVFTRTKHGANRLTQQLEGSGIRAAAIHGNKSQGARVRALPAFKENPITAPVATHV